MRRQTVEPLSEEQINDLAVRTVRAIRADRRGALWCVKEVADYLGYSQRHVRRLIANGELEGSRSRLSAAWRVPVASMLAYEDRRDSSGYALRRSDEMTSAGRCLRA